MLNPPVVLPPPIVESRTPAISQPTYIHTTTAAGETAFAIQTPKLPASPPAVPFLKCYSALHQWESAGACNSRTPPLHSLDTAIQDSLITLPITPPVTPPVTPSVTPSVTLLFTRYRTPQSTAPTIQHGYHKYSPRWARTLRIHLHRPHFFQVSTQYSSSFAPQFS